MTNGIIFRVRLMMNVKKGLVKVLELKCKIQFETSQQDQKIEGRNLII
jgi:hypothetical protein